MLEISLDTCAFFAMIKYNEVYDKGGMQALNYTLKEDEDKLKELEKNILANMSPDFLKKYPNLSFEKKLDFYKDYATSIDALAKVKIETYIKNSQGIFYDQNGNEFIREISEDRKNLFLKKAQLFQEMREQASKSYNYYLQAREDYKLLADNYQMGLIYKGALNGEYDLSVSTTPYAEILNHEADNDSESTKGFVKFEQSKIDALFDHCSFPATFDKEIRDKIDEIALEFRTKREEEKMEAPDTKEMAPDINSLGFYGDSTMAAEASITGKILVTLNKKDFIYDKSIKQYNDYIRRHIAYVEKKYAPYTTDALPYSPAEVLSGKIARPSRKPYYQIEINDHKKQIQECNESIAE